MQMPLGWIIQDRKLTHYLLIYQARDDKSEFLARAGYTLQNWKLLRRDILGAMEEAEVVEVTSTDWGNRFRFKTQWIGLNGQSLKVITIWQQDEGVNTLRFVTLYPDKSKTIDALEEESK